MSDTIEIGSGENVVISESIVAPVGQPAVDITGDDASLTVDEDGSIAAILIMKMTITILENMSSIKLNSFMSQLNFTGLISHLSF